MFSTLTNCDICTTLFVFGMTKACLYSLWLGNCGKFYFYDLAYVNIRKNVPFLFYPLFCKTRWQNTSLQLTTSLTSCTVSFMLGFSRLCYYLVKTGNIKISAVLSTNNDTGVNTLSFPELGDVCIDMDRAETFGLMTVRAKLRNSIIKILYNYKF